MSIYKDLISNIDDNGFLSYKFDINKYNTNKINTSYSPGGADAFYVFSNKFDSSYKEDNTIIDLLEDFKNDYDIKKFYTDLVNYIEDKDDYLLLYNIDYINEYFSKNRDSIKPEMIYKLSKYIINETDNTEALKLGIYLISQFDLGRIDKKMILDLALCDEFTFYSLFYGIIKFDDSNELIFNLLKKVFGIGRLFLIDQLKVDSNEKREYLVLNSNIESISNIGVGRIIGTKINIQNYILEKVVGDIYIGLSNIINSLVFSEYKLFEKYEELFNNYIDRFIEYSNYSISYFVITNIYNYIDDNHIKNKIYNLVSSKKFKNIMIDNIKNSNDINMLYEITYLLCNIDSFGLEKYIYKRFRENCYKYSFMIDLLIEKDKYREDSLKIMYDNFIFLDGDISNEINEYSIESLKNKYIISVMEKYPYCNEEFIIRSLFSKYLDIRNATLNTLYTWNRESDVDFKNTKIYDKLIELKDKETSIEIKRSICELLDIDEKFKGKDKIKYNNIINLDYDNINELDDNTISFNDRRSLVCSCIKKDNKYTIYIINTDNRINRVDLDISDDGKINSYKCDSKDKDIEILFSLYYIKDKYYG